MRQYLSLPRTVHVLCLGVLINRAGTMLVPFLTLYLQSRIGLGIETATRVMGAYGAGALVAAILGGHLADRFGRKRVMVGSLVGGAAILGLFPLLHAPWQVAVGLFVFASVGEMYRPATQAMIADLVEPGRRPAAFALMYVAVNLGFAIAPVIGGLLAATSFRWLCWVDALTNAAYALLLLGLVRESRPAPSAAGAVDRSGAVIAGAVDGHVGTAAAIGAILRDGTMLAFCAGIVLVGLSFMQVASTFPLYLGQLGIDAKQYGRIIAVNGLMITVLQLPFASLVSRWRRDLVMIASGVVLGVGFFLNAFARTPWQFTAVVVVWTLGEMLNAVFAPTIVSDLAPPALRGRYLGVFTMCFSSAAMFGAPLGGLVLARGGGLALWTAVLLLGLGAAAFSAVAAPGIRRRTGGPEASPV
ncbi:MAG: MFS transporter [bacterium]|nr:MFS transporter [bacterium]